MKIKTYLFFNSIFLITISLLISCSASTGSRYDSDDKNSKENSSNKTNDLGNSKTLKEDFDITPFKTKIIFPEKKQYSSDNTEEIWIDYSSSQKGNGTKSLIGTADGYRVLVLATDNLEEANQLKEDVYLTNNANEVYLDFEPPFYKLKIGDFDSQRNADELRFKLNQLGYKEAKVVKDKINVFK